MCVCVCVSVNVQAEAPRHNDPECRVEPIRSWATRQTSNTRKTGGAPRTGSTPRSLTRPLRFVARLLGQPGLGSGDGDCSIALVTVAHAGSIKGAQHCAAVSACLSRPRLGGNHAGGGVRVAVEAERCSCVLAFYFSV